MHKPYTLKITAIVVVALILAILAWSVVDAAEDTGIRVTGNVLDCVGGRSRQCVIAISSINKQVWVFNPGGKKGGAVLLKKMERPITKAVSYEIAY